MAKIKSQISRTRPREFKGIPGSVYNERGRLVVKLPGQKAFYTGLQDTATNYIIALQKLKSMYLESIGLGRSKSEAIFVQDAFSSFMQVKKDKSAKLKTALKLSFNHFVGEENFILTRDNILNGVESYLKTSNVSNVSINNYLRHFQVFLNYCWDRQWIDKIALSKLYKKNTPLKEPKVFTSEEVRTLLKYFKSSNYKFYVLIALQLTTGLRVGECLNLMKDQVKDNSIYLGNKTRYYAEKVHITKEMQELLLALNTGIKVFHWSPNTYSRLLRTFKEGMRECSIPDDRGFHSLRKTYRSILKNENIMLEDVQVMMRHSNINLTTDVYTKFDKSTFTKTAESITTKLEIF